MALAADTFAVVTIVLALTVDGSKLLRLPASARERGR